MMICLAEPFQRVHVFIWVNAFLQEQSCVFKHFLCSFTRLGVAAFYQRIQTAPQEIHIVVEIKIPQ